VIDTDLINRVVEDVMSRDDYDADMDDEEQDSDGELI